MLLLPICGAYGDIAMAVTEPATTSIVSALEAYSTYENEPYHLESVSC